VKKVLLLLIPIILLFGTGETWTRLYPGGTAPSGRWGTASVYDASVDRFLIFGGAIWGAAYNHVYALDSTLTGDGVWTQLYPTGSGPSGRGFCAPVYDEPRQRLIVFGGYNMAGSCYNQVYFLDSICNTAPHWSYVSVGGTAPLIRQSAAAAYDPIQERVIYFSGWCGYQWRNDIYVLENLGTSPAWRRLYPTGGGPGGRWGATCVYDHINDRLYVFGGMNTSQTYPSDTWVLENLQTSDGNWVNLNPGGQVPTGRMWSVSAFNSGGDRMLMFGGGYFQSTCFSDLRSLDPLSGTPSWTLLSPSGTGPTARYGATWAMDNVRQRIILFGGNYSSSNYNDVYVLTWDLGIAESNNVAPHNIAVTSRPNPFNESVVIRCDGERGFVSSVAVYNVQGQFIRYLSSTGCMLPANLFWDGRDEQGLEVPAGTYFVVMEINKEIILEQIIRLR
jgi:hypothetical protein